MWLEVYVAFNDLQNLNILLWMKNEPYNRQLNICEIYWETANTSPSAPPTFCGEQHSVPNFEKMGEGGGKSEKNECLGRLKEFLPQIFACRLTVFLVKKDWKMKYGFDDSISYADLGLFQLPNNQLMFSFVTLWFC